MTPKKIGQFVTFWKRDLDGKTVPFDVNDDFDFYIIAIEENENSGFFVFPKVILEKENLISSEKKLGKEVSEFMQIGIPQITSRLKKLSFGKPNISLIILILKILF